MVCKDFSEFIKTAEKNALSGKLGKCESDLSETGENTGGAWKLSVKNFDFAEAYCFIIFKRSLRTWQRHFILRSFFNGVDGFRKLTPAKS